MATAVVAAPLDPPTTYTVAGVGVSIALFVFVPTQVAGVKRLALPPPLRTWTGSTWNRPAVTTCRRLVIPVPIKRWNGTSWVTLRTPHS